MDELIRELDGLGYLFAVFIGLVGAFIGLRLLHEIRVYVLRSKGVYPRQGTETDEDVVRLINRQELVLAVRCYRAIHGGSLGNAKKQVSALRTHQEST